MFKTGAIEAIESGEMNLAKDDAEEIVVTNGASWKCPTYVRKLPPCRFECPSSEDIRGIFNRYSAVRLFQKRSGRIVRRGVATTDR